MKPFNTLLTRWTTASFLLLLCIWACRKTDKPQNEAQTISQNYSQLKAQFFNTAAADPEVQKVAADIKRQDSFFKFLPDFVKKNGIPKWDKAIYKVQTKGSTRQSSSIANRTSSADSGAQGVFFIPLQSTTSSEIKSYITAYKHNDSFYTYRLYNRDSLNNVHPSTSELKTNLLNTQAVFGVFEKSINGKDSIQIQSPVQGKIKNASLTIGEQQTGRNSNTNRSGSLNRTADCSITLTISIEYSLEMTFDGTTLTITESLSMSLEITIDCSGGGGGGCGCGSGFTDGGDPNGGGNGSNWWNWGTGWPWNNNGGGYSDPNWYWWWTGFGGGGGITPIQSFIGTLSPSQMNFWNDPNNFIIVNALTDRLTQSNFSLEEQDFVRWAIDYLNNNPNVNFQDFYNQFLSPPEGQDGNYDSNYWDDPNLTFPPQTLPSWNSFKAAYPKHSDPSYDTPAGMYSAVGGTVLNLYNSNPSAYQNTCALRISRALNYSGITIQPGTDRYQGADGKYYFLSAAALLKWMKKTFGTPTGSNHLTGAQGGQNGQNFPSLLSGKKGIYIMTPNLPGGCPSASNPQGTGFCASGHADMIENSICDGGCYFNARGGVNEIFIWEMQ